jgi:hypothetical protein
MFIGARSNKDNVRTLDARDAKFRIANPADPDRRSRKFSWLICETRGEKGSAVIYEYKPEESALVDLAQAHERNRGVSHDSCSDADCIAAFGQRDHRREDGGTAGCRIRTPPPGSDLSHQPPSEL